MTFDVEKHITKLPRQEKDKETGAKRTVHDDYLEVKWRLVWFRQECPNGTIDTEELAYDLDRVCEAEGWAWSPEKKKSERVQKRAAGYARYRAVVTDGKGGRGTGTKSESRVNFEDFGEKAETGAIGRALAALGYGTQFTGDELSEGKRIVDSPVADQNGHSDPKPSEAQHNGTGHQPRTTAPTEAKATSADASAQKQAKEAAIKYINPLKVEAVKVEFIYGESDAELLDMWQKRLRAIFGREVSDADLIESEALRGTVREAMERYAAKNAASGK